MKPIDLIGRRFGRLVVLARAERRGHSHCWLCRCDCGCEKVIHGSALLGGLTNSCGCLNKEASLARFTTHNMSQSRLYREYSSMKRRCFNPNVQDYMSYGGRGITVCDEWRNSFEAFRDWALANGYRDDLSLERKDVNGNYEPSNCCWITMEEQAGNKRNTIHLTFRGKTLTLAQWSELTGINHATLYSRLKRGWSVDQILTVGTGSDKP